MTEKQYHISVMCPQEMKESLSEVAKKRGFLNMSECIRGIIRDYLKRSENGTPNK